MKKYVLGLFAVVVAISLSAFTNKSEKKTTKLTDYYWYVVDYSSNPSGEVPAGATPVFGGVKKTQAFAQANDGCEDIDQLHCLRGFISQPGLPTTSFDESTPMPEQ